MVKEVKKIGAKEKGPLTLKEPISLDKEGEATKSIRKTIENIIESLTESFKALTLLI